MKKIYALIAVTIVLTAASVAVIVNAGKPDSFFEANVEALADVEDNNGNMGHHVEMCGSLFFVNGLSANCANPVTVCDFVHANGCVPTYCSVHK